MSEGAIEPSAVYSPGAPIRTGRQKFYDTYNTRYIPDPVGGDPAITSGGGGGGGGIPTPGFDYSGGFLHRTMQNLPNGSGPVVTVPHGIPRFLGARPMLFFAWGVAMIMVSLDEWHTHHILPRPARLWYTSLLFFLLAMVSIIDVAVPIVNLFALGMVITLGYQYYSGSGQFGAAAKQSTIDTSVTTGGLNQPTPGTGTLSVTPPYLGNLSASDVLSAEAQYAAEQQYIAQQGNGPITQGVGQ